jgi:mannose-1-phosphate guanylyltransferase
MPSQQAFGSSKNWAIVLAGGEGSRLLSLTRRIAGTDLPKQFCPLTGEHSLLEQTIRRASLLLPEANILTVVNRAHQPFYEKQDRLPLRALSVCQVW